MSATRKRGRQKKYNDETFFDICKNYVNLMFDGEQKIVSVTSAVWKDIVKDINKTLKEGEKTSASAIHTYVTCNRGNILNELRKQKFGATAIEKTASNLNVTSSNPSLSASVNDDNSLNFTLNNSRQTQAQSRSESTFSFRLTKNEVDKKLTEFVYKEDPQDRIIRTERILKADVWTDRIRDAIWYCKKMGCAFAFKNGYISNQMDNGKINGKKLFKQII